MLTLPGPSVVVTTTADSCPVGYSADPALHQSRAGVNQLHDLLGHGVLHFSMRREKGVGTRYVPGPRLPAHHALPNRDRRPTEAGVAGARGNSMPFTAS